MPSSRRLKTIIVEDEEAPRQLLRRHLERRHADLIEIVAEAQTGPEALALCEAHQPDVLFVDLHLPGFDGLELISQVGGEVHVVITTADAQHAVDAYRVNAVDYLLKPIDPDQLAEAIARITSSIAGERVVRLLCRDRDVTKIVHTDDVFFLQADGGYTNVQTKDKYYLLNDSLVALEERLPEHFVRVHRTTIVNAHHVSGLSQANEFIEFGDSHRVPISRRHLREFRRKVMYVK